ncbi:hypothetical protein CBI36_08525 [Acetobacter oryzifermentans]|uniref:Uncharacterized protein n=1 Tax=Acetobacter oryzifermentans TaxID=1633874 RepID=A0ABC8CEV8_9PROT|nr:MULTISPECIES: hypothetical protein [Acetobacter]ASL40463.1 hypothetical protein CBI36_08525 [Acetobacter oryzifermentans]
MQLPTAAETSSAYSPTTRILVSIGLMMTMIMGALNQSIVSTALLTIVSDLGGLVFRGHGCWTVRPKIAFLLMLVEMAASLLRSSSN